MLTNYLYDRYSSLLDPYKEQNCINYKFYYS
jgi:hypothetical protein